MNLQENIRRIIRETVNESKGWGNSNQNKEDKVMYQQETIRKVLIYN